MMDTWTPYFISGLAKNIKKYKVLEYFRVTVYIPLELVLIILLMNILG